jgi:uncharacterized protein (DUF1501 family)
MYLQTPHGMTRRHFVSHLAGAAGLAGSALALGHSLRANAAQLTRNHKSCILLWMGGGPPTIDMWDMKPGATTGGQFKPIATAGAGQINELMPLVAKQMNRLSIVRSMSTREADHTRGTYYLHTGFVPNPNVLHPGYGSVVAHELREQANELEIPPFVAIGGASEGPGFLGMAYAPFQVDSGGRVRDLQASVEEARMTDRMQLLGMLEERFIGENRGAAAAEHAKVLTSTLDLMTSRQMDAFRVDQEEARVRERYGDTGFGRGCLMARRLVEAGVDIVTTEFDGPQCGRVQNWDDHAVNHHVFDALKYRAPFVDQAVSALIEDVYARGLDRRVLVVVTGEFGRTPRISYVASSGGGVASAAAGTVQPGRDHWPQAGSMLFAGGGIRTGQVIGATDPRGEAPIDRRVGPEDFLATLYQHLGIDWRNATLPDFSGRPTPIIREGEAIRELGRAV